MAVGRLNRYGLPYSNVVGTGTATNQITQGKTLESIQLKLGGTAMAIANIEMFKLKANGKVIYEGSGAEIQKLNAYRQAGTTNAKFLELCFSDYSLNNEFDRHVGAFDTTIGIANITTELQIKGADAPTVTPILIEAASQKSRGGEAAPYAALISKVLRYPFSVATGGKLPVTLPFGAGNGSIIKRVHVFHSGKLTDATVKQDGIVIFEATQDENEFMQKRHQCVPQANMFTIDFVVDGDIKKALDTRDARSLEWLFSFSEGDNGTIVVEYLDPLGNL
jgi:hypothetical protein